MNVADGTGDRVHGSSGRAAAPARPWRARFRAGRRREASVPLGTLSTAAASGPFRREGLLARILPFAVVAGLAELSLALPPGPRSVPFTVASLALLAATAVIILLLPWDRAPRSLAVVAPLLYTASVLPLLLTSGGTSSGISVVLLIPLTWTALFHRPWESGCVICAILVVLFVASFLPDEASTSDIIRRLVFWGALASVIAVAAHGLRGRIRRSQQATARLQGQLRELSILRDRDRIAGNLQDTVMQRLFAAGLTLQGIGLLAGQPEVGERIEKVVHDLDEAIRLLRQSIFGLEHGLPEQGLRRTILDVTGELTPVLGLVPEVTLDGPIDTDIPAQVAGPLISTLRDTLGHSGTQARATRVAVSVVTGGDEVRLTVSDDGDRWTARAPADGAWLSSVRERAHRLGGDVEADSADGETSLTWRVPIRRADPASAGGGTGLPGGGPTGGPAGTGTRARSRSPTARRRPPRART